MMFKDVGKEIKELAENHAWSKALAYGFITFVIALAAGSAWAGGVAPIIVPALLIAVVGGVVGYRKGRSEAMLIYSWGELVDRVTSLERKLSGDCDRKIVIVKKKTISPDGDILPLDEEDEEDEEDKKEEPQKGSGEPLATRLSDGRWQCAYCGRINPADAESCTKSSCGCVPSFK